MITLLLFITLPTTTNTNTSTGYLVNVQTESINMMIKVPAHSLARLHVRGHVAASSRRGVWIPFSSRSHLSTLATNSSMSARTSSQWGTSHNETNPVATKPKPIGFRFFSCRSIQQKQQQQQQQQPLLQSRLFSSSNDNNSDSNNDSSSTTTTSHSDFAPQRKAVPNDTIDQAKQIIAQHVTENRVMLYMKGTPSLPMCGFSSQVVRVLQQEGVDFASVNVLDYPSIREGIKKFSDWPTIPQLYVNGRLCVCCCVFCCCCCCCVVSRYRNAEEK